MITTRSEWLTYQEAMELTGRSKRTLLRWLKDPNIHIEVWRPARIALLLRSDVLAVEAEMDSRSEKPSFGKKHAELAT